MADVEECDEPATSVQPSAPVVGQLPDESLCRTWYFAEPLTDACCAAQVRCTASYPTVATVTLFGPCTMFVK